jgi:hypothetical protein
MIRIGSWNGQGSPPEILNVIRLAAGTKTAGASQAAEKLMILFSK